jgi:acyl-coenzyme A synthetase/AMP-(fatty) acid ligase
MNVTGVISMHAQLRPRAPAVVTPALSLNFGQLDALVWRTAVGLRKQGLEAGQAVVLDIQDSAAHLIVALALARTGVAHFSGFRGHDPAAVAPLAERVRAVRTITDSDARELANAAPASDVRAGIQSIAAGMMRYGATPWLYIFSSGTTARPKIIPLTHEITLHRCRRLAAGIPMVASDRYLPLSELAFQAAKGRAFNTLIIGGCVVFAEGLDGAQLLDFIGRTGVTRMSCAPVHLHRLCAASEGRMLLPRLRALDVVGATVTEDLRRRARDRVTPNLYVSYGASEAGVVTVAPPQARTPDTVGYALPGVQLQIVDEADRPLPRGEVGRVRMRTPGMIPGYLDDADMTARMFKEGWFYPGDLGALSEDEQLIFRGRADDMMLFDGINIYPAEIESALAAHEAVAEAAAFALESELHQHVPAAAVTLRSSATEEQLLAFCRQRLGARAPQRIAIVDAFPRNPIGKIVKRDLPELVRGALVPPVLPAG